MPFSKVSEYKEISWNSHLHGCFSHVRDIGLTFENEYYGAYNHLLLLLFPTSGNFSTGLERQNYASDDSPMSFVVRHREHPVFVLAVKPQGAIEDESQRQGVHEEVRAWMECLDDVVIPTLYSASVFGTKICCYRYDVHTSAIDVFDGPRLHSRSSAATAMNWQMDVLAPIAEQRLFQIANHVKEMCDDTVPMSRTDDFLQIDESLA